MPYTPPFQKQLDGSRFGGSNCTVASSCMAAVRHQRGVNPVGTAPWYPYPSWVRAVMGDTSGGTNLGQNSSIFYYKYGVRFTVSYKIPWLQFRNYIAAGRGAVLQGGYDVVLPTRFDASGTFTGNHAIYVNAVRWNSTYKRYEFHVADPLADGRRVGIPRGYQWWPESLLRAFAGRLVVGSSRLGAGYVYAMFTRDTEAVSYTPPPVTTDGVKVTLRYGGVKASARRVYSKYHYTAVYSQPSTTSQKLRVESFGDYVFVRHQIAKSSWFGNVNGTQWVHNSRVRF